jgi:hypothetical protein
MLSCLRVAAVWDVWCSLIKGRVRAHRVVEPNPIINDPFCLETVRCPASDRKAICRERVICIMH